MVLLGSMGIGRPPDGGLYLGTIVWVYAVDDVAHGALA